MNVENMHATNRYQFLKWKRMRRLVDLKSFTVIYWHTKLFYKSYFSHIYNIILLCLGNIFLPTRLTFSKFKRDTIIQLSLNTYISQYNKYILLRSFCDRHGFGYYLEFYWHWIIICVICSMTKNEWM